MKKVLVAVLLLVTLIPRATSQTPEGNPFKRLGYNAAAYTFGVGKEFHDRETVVIIGNTLFDTKKNEVIGFIDNPDSLTGLRPELQSMSVDPHCEKYVSVSPYVFCLNNPIRFVDPDGREVDLSGISEEERKRYTSQVTAQRENSKLFDAMYSSLESSKNVYVIKYGQTISDTSGPVEGQFAQNKDGGGTVTFSEESLDIKSETMTEELFHAYQYDNKVNYANGDFNFEFEAKIAVTAIGSEGGSGYGNIEGMGDFQSKIGFGDYGKGLMQITPENVSSNTFISDYKKAANSYSKYNTAKGIGNSHYKTATTVSPYSLQKMIKKAYGK